MSIGENFFPNNLKLLSEYDPDILLDPIYNV